MAPSAPTHIDTIGVYVHRNNVAIIILVSRGVGWEKTKTTVGMGSSGIVGSHSSSRTREKTKTTVGMGSSGMVCEEPQIPSGLGSGDGSRVQGSSRIVCYPRCCTQHYLEHMKESMGLISSILALYNALRQHAEPTSPVCRHRHVVVRSITSDPHLVPHPSTHELSFAKVGYKLWYQS